MVPYHVILESEMSITVKIATKTRVGQTDHRTDKNSVDEHIGCLLCFPGYLPLVPLVESPIDQTSTIDPRLPV